MAFLYHRVPDPMQGTMLYPLNQLKEKLPDVYRRAIEKYVGREQSMEEKILQTYLATFSKVRLS